MRAVRLIAAVLLVVLTVTPALAQRVSGDAGAWEEVKAAFDRLQALRTYRMIMALAPELSAQRQMTMLTEVVNPDRRRTVVEFPEGTAESIIVGRQVASRFVNRSAQPAVPQPSLGLGGLIGAFMDPVGFLAGFLMQAAVNAMMQAAVQRFMGWRCQTLDEAGGSSGGQEGGESEVEVGRLSDATLGGVPVRVYRIVWRMPGQPTGEQRLYVTADGMPRRSEMFDQGKPMMGTDYQDFNAPITIELPRCN
ncbi:MAG: hypothetical protein QN162_02480 [Armatimonadota bacterium]|nr:hypothetical protein [Armatimonadota bacterium]